MDSRPCCATWDRNELITESPTWHVRADGFPVADGHVLAIPKRHVESLFDLWIREWDELLYVLQFARIVADGYTIAVNDGAAAGRTVDHLHIHLIPRRWGDIEDPRGGIRRLLIPDPAQDPWLTSREPDHG